LTFISLYSNNLSDKLEEQLRQITTLKILLNIADDKESEQPVMDVAAVNGKVNGKVSCNGTLGQHTTILSIVTGEATTATIQTIAPTKTEPMEITNHVTSQHDELPLQHTSQDFDREHRKNEDFMRVIESAGSELTLGEFWNYKGKQVRMEESIAAQGLKELLESSLSPLPGSNSPSKKRRQL